MKTQNNHVFTATHNSFSPRGRMSLKLQRPRVRTEESSSAPVPIRLVRSAEKNKRVDHPQKSQRLQEWIIKSENAVRFLIEDPEQGKVVSYPKATFQKEFESGGAFREGDSLFISKHKKSR